MTHPKNRLPKKAVKAEGGIHFINMLQQQPGLREDNLRMHVLP
ncbi:Uncharacterised protein [Vibrio cholerae]|nr:Uncharacterised protein [Vibrio cholerae]CSI93209.1 Uncharacterised protein [Vibrio cholerae]